MLHKPCKHWQHFYRLSCHCCNRRHDGRCKRCRKDCIVSWSCCSDYANLRQIWLHSYRTCLITTSGIAATNQAQRTCICSQSAHPVPIVLAYSSCNTYLDLDGCSRRDFCCCICCLSNGCSCCLCCWCCSSSSSSSSTLSVEFVEDDLAQSAILLVSQWRDVRAALSPIVHMHAQAYSTNYAQNFIVSEIEIV